MRWKYNDPREWHRFYCWLPMVIGGTCVWLEHAERRLRIRDVVDVWDYRNYPGGE